jgi:excalibur calcium-binding domain-containing protein
LKIFSKASRVDALAAGAVFVVAFAAMVLSPPLDTVKLDLMAITANWSTPEKSSANEAASKSSWLEAPPPEPVVRSGAAEVHYRNCAAAWAAGAAPIYIGEPGYEPRLDGDSDGIACEPFRRGRR